MSAPGFIDLHVHLLPAVDDGPGSLEETVAALEIAHAGGTRRLVATPHMFSPLFDTPGAAGIRSAHARLSDELAAASERPESAFLRDLEVDLGAENHLSPEMLEAARARDVLTLNGGRYLLVELPFYTSREVARAAIQILLDSGYVPVLAHVERYPFFVETDAALDPFLAAGCLALVNAASLLPAAGRRLRRDVRRLLRSGSVQAVASDGHGAGHRSPDLGAVHRELAARFSPELAARWLYENPLAIVEDRSLSP